MLLNWGFPFVIANLVQINQKIQLSKSDSSANQVKDTFSLCTIKVHYVGSRIDWRPLYWCPGSGALVNRNACSQSTVHTALEDALKDFSFIYKDSTLDMLSHSLELSVRLIRGWRRSNSFALCKQIDSGGLWPNGSNRERGNALIRYTLPSRWRVVIMAAGGGDDGRDGESWNKGSRFDDWQVFKMIHVQ